MKTLVPAFLLLLPFSLNAQYYYNDIVGTMETNRQMKTYLANKVKTVSAKGVPTESNPRTSYSEFQELRENGRALKISMFNNGTKTVYYNRFDEGGRLVSITDSTSDIQNVTAYEYDAAGKIVLVKSTTRDLDSNVFSQTEVHQWIYLSNGKPDKMWRITNNTDSVEIRFKPDENGNPGEERSYRRGVETGASYYYYDENKQLRIITSGVIYYYYDDKNRLSDIVRFNLKKGQLLPDVMFEYDDSDRVVQRITTTSSLNLSYLIWRYIFDAKGLKTKDALFNKNKELTGKIEYTYTFAE